MALHFQYVDVSHVLGSSELDPAHSRCGLTNDEQSGRNTSLDLLVKLSLIQPILSSEDYTSECLKKIRSDFDF